MTHLSRTFIIKGNANDKWNPASCPFPALMTPFPFIIFVNEEAIYCINEEATVATQQGVN